MYLPDSHSSVIPFARSLHFIFFDDLKWSMLMPVVWYVALARFVFPELMHNECFQKGVHPSPFYVRELSVFVGGCIVEFYAELF